jgi:hypothetical protein
VGGVADRGANAWTWLTDWARGKAERTHDRIEADRGARPGEEDQRGWRQRLSDVNATCPDCRHGGRIAHRHDCNCKRCLCQYVEKPRPSGPQPEPPAGASPAPTDQAGDPPPPTPSPVGGDGSASPTDPTDPTPTTPGEPESTTEGDDVSVPTATNGPAQPTPTAGATSGGGTTRGSLPTLDVSDVRFADARLYFNQHARESDLIAVGLESGGVHPQILGLIRDKKDRDQALVARINMIYGPVENAMASAAHVAETRTYKHR